MARIPNYKVNASIYKVFDSNSDTNPASETDSRFTIVETYHKKQKSNKKEDKNLLRVTKSKKKI